MADEIVPAAPAGTPTSTPAPAPATEPTSATSAAPAPATAETVPAAAPTSTEAPQTNAPAAPEKYDFASAEGKVQPAVLAKFEGVARELGLSQEAAVKLIDTVAPEMQAAVKAHQDATVSKWATDAKADKEFGGDKLNENMAIAKKALEAFGSPELTKFLDTTGLGNHPELIRAFFRAGQKISSGSFVPSGGAPAGAKDPSKALYPSMN